MRILVVEDHHRIANSIKKGLEQETFSVDTAFDGITGFDLANTESYDAIILDIMLPGMTGLEICTKLRQNKIHTPILMLTAKSEIEDKVEGLNSGADDYLTKPFAFEELLARLRALLRRPTKALDTILSCGNLEMDLSNFSVTKNGKTIVLSKKEFALLEYFIRNKNKTLTKEQIIEHVWNYESDVLPNNVEQYVGYLRNKIDKPFGKKHYMLHTVRGFGYTLKDF